MQSGDRDRDQTPESTERSVAFEPVDKKRWEVPEEETKTYGGGPPKGGPNMMMVGAAVVVILILVIVIIAIAM